MRVHRTLIASLAVALAVAVAVPAVAAARRLIIGGSTSVLPLAQKLASAYHKEFPKIPTPSVSGGQSDIGISGAAEGRFDIGDASRDPIKGVDPPGLVFTKIARDGVCVVTNPANRLSRPLRRKRHGDLHRALPRLEPGTRRKNLGADRPVRPRWRLLRYPGRLPAHLPGRIHQDLPQRDGRDLQRPRAERRGQRQAGDRLRLPLLHGRRQPRQLRGRALHAAQRQGRAVRGRA